MPTRTKQPPATTKSQPAKPRGRPLGSKNKPRVADDDPSRYENLDPLTFLLRQMNDSTIDPKIRQRAAIAAAQYKHVKRGYSGKKEAKQKAAVDATKKPGGFAPMAAPTRLRSIK